MISNTPTSTETVRASEDVIRQQCSNMALLALKASSEIRSALDDAQDLILFHVPCQVEPTTEHTSELIASAKDALLAAVENLCKIEVETQYLAHYLGEDPHG